MAEDKITAAETANEGTKKSENIVGGNKYLGR